MFLSKKKREEEKERKRREQEERKRKELKEREQKKYEKYWRPIAVLDLQGQFPKEISKIHEEVVGEEIKKSPGDQYEDLKRLYENFTKRVRELPGIILGYHIDWRGFTDDFINTPKVDAKLPQECKDKHIYVIGRTGSGKTNLLRNLIAQDLEKRGGFGVIAPELEFLTEEILPYIPENRVDDVIYVNPADQENPVAFNPLEMEEGEDIDRKTDDLLVIFQRALGKAGPQMLPILRNSFYALCERKGTTLLDIYKLLSRQDPSFRDEILRTTQNPTVARFFKEDYPLMRSTSHLPITNRLDSFVGVKIIRNILCSSQSSFSFSKAMDEDRILLFNLSDGILGQENSQLLGQLVVSKFQQALMSRAVLSKKKRKPFTLYIDEFQTFTSAATESYEKILSRARKYKLSLILAHQQTEQIPDRLLKEILGNVSTIISFNISYVDAQKIAKEFISEDHFGEIAQLEPDKFLALEVGQAYCKTGKSFFKMQAYLADQNPDFERAKKVIEASRRNYGIKTTSEAFKQPIRPASGQTSEEGGYLE